MGGTKGNKESRGTFSVALEFTLHTTATCQNLESCPSIVVLSGGTDLFTFWPPGPPERLNEISPMWRGTDGELNLESHSRAAVKSSSVRSARRVVNDLRNAALYRKKGEGKRGRSMAPDCTGTTRIRRPSPCYPCPRRRARWRAVSARPKPTPGDLIEPEQVTWTGARPSKA